jgi:hypothetical protein
MTFPWGEFWMLLCSGDPVNGNMYFLISADNEPPKFITGRGSSQLEALWRALEKLWVGATMGAETADCAMLDFFVRWNLKRSTRIRGMNGGLDLNSVDLDSLEMIQSDQRYLSEHYNAQLPEAFEGLVIPKWDASTDSSVIQPTSFFGCGHEHFSNEAVLAHKQKKKVWKDRADEVPVGDS